MAPTISRKFNPKWNPSTTDLTRRTNRLHKQVGKTSINSISINHQPRQFYRWTTPSHDATDATPGTDERTLNQIWSRSSRPFALRLADGLKRAWRRSLSLTGPLSLDALPSHPQPYLSSPRCDTALLRKKGKEGLYSQCKVSTVKSSLTFNLETTALLAFRSKTAARAS